METFLKHEFVRIELQYIYGQFYFETVRCESAFLISELTPVEHIPKWFKALFPSTFTF